MMARCVQRVDPCGAPLQYHRGKRAGHHHRVRFQLHRTAAHRLFELRGDAIDPAVDDGGMRHDQGLDLGRGIESDPGVAQGSAFG